MGPGSKQNQLCRAHGTLNVCMHPSIHGQSFSFCVECMNVRMVKHCAPLPDPEGGCERTRTNLKQWRGCRCQLFARLWRHVRESARHLCALVRDWVGCPNVDVLKSNVAHWVRLNANTNSGRMILCQTSRTNRFETLSNTSVETGTASRLAMERTSRPSKSAARAHRLPVVFET